MYLTGCKNPKVTAAARLTGSLGLLNTPAARYDRSEWPVWAADNGAFNAKTYKGDDAWFAWLSAQDPEGCLFATAPDVVGDAAATFERSMPWLPRIRALGFPAAFVAQDGLEDLAVPWDAFDVLFIGGTTEWKLGAAARQIVADAKTRGKHVHMGRVNSERRLRYAAHIGCDSADGTFLAFGPDVNLPRLLAWLRGVSDQGDLFGDAA